LQEIKQQQIKWTIKEHENINCIEMKIEETKVHEHKSGESQEWNTKLERGEEEELELIKEKWIKAWIKPRSKEF